MGRGQSAKSQVKGLSAQFKKDGTGNRYRFENFAQRVSQAKFEARVAPRRIDVYADRQDDETLCYFKEELAAWNEKNLTLGYKAVARKLYSLSQSLPQVIHHLDEIVQHLAEGIRTVPPISQEPLFALVCVLARDLRAEFMPHFRTIFLAILSAIDVNDPESMGQIFQTLSILFKYLAKDLVQNLGTVRSLYFELLMSKKEHLQGFAAESWAFLLRKLKGKSLRGQVRSILNALTPSALGTPTIEGVGMVLFELVKSVQHQLHSNTEHVARAMLSSLRPASEASSSATTLMARGEEMLAVRHAVVQVCLTRVCEHSRREYFAVVWDAVLAEVGKALQTWLKDNTAKNGVANVAWVVRTLELLTLCMSHRGGQRLDASTNVPDQIVALVRDLLLIHGKETFAEPGLFSAALDLALALCAWPLSSTTDSFIKQLPQVLLHVNTNRAESVRIDAFYEQAIRRSHGRYKILNLLVHPAVQFYDRAFIVTQPEQSFIRLRELGERVSGMTDEERRGIPITAINHSSGKLRIDIWGGPHKESAFGIFKDGLARLREYLDKNTGKCPYEFVWTSLHALPFLDLGANEDQVIDTLDSCAQELDNTIASGTKTSVVKLNMLKAGCIVAAVKAGGRQAMTGSRFGGARGVLHWIVQDQNCRSSTMLQAAADYFVATVHALPTDEAVLKKLQKNLLSPSHIIRRATLQIFLAMKPLDYTVDQTAEDTTDDGRSGPCNIVELLLKIELSPLTVLNERERPMHLDRIGSILRSGRVPAMYIELLMHAIVGMFHVKYSRVWPAATEHFPVLAEKNWVVFWNILYEQILQARASRFVVGGVNTMDNAGEMGDAFQVACDEYTHECDDTRINYACPFGPIESSHDNLVYMNTGPEMYEELIWTAIADKIPKYAERQSPLIFTYFLEFLRDEYYPSINRDDADEKILNAEELLGKLELEWRVPNGRPKNDRSELIFDMFPSQCAPLATATNKTTSNQLKSLLKLFSAYVKPTKSCKSASKDMFELYKRFLMKSDQDLARWALRCIFTFREDSINSYRSILENLVDEKLFRDQMVSLHLHTSNIEIKTEHRPLLIDIIIRLSFGKLMTRKGKSAKDTLQTRRATVLSFLSELDESEMKGLFDLVMSPFSSEDINGVSHGKQMGFVKMIEDIVDKLGSKSLSYLPGMMMVVLQILNTTISNCDEGEMLVDEDDAFVDADAPILNIRVLRTQCLRRFGSIFLKFPDMDFGDVIFDHLRSLIVAHAENLPNSVVGQVASSAMLELVVSITASRFLSRKMLNGAGSRILECSLRCLSKCPPSGDHGPSVSLIGVLTLVENLLSMEEDEEEMGFHENPLIPLLPTLLEEFYIRLKQFDDLKRSRRELVILSKVSNFMILQQKTVSMTKEEAKQQQELCLKLVGLLVPFLKPAHRLRNDVKTDIIVTVQALSEIVEDMSSYIPLLSRLFAPGNGALEGSAREALVSLYVNLSKLPHTEWLEPAANMLVDLNAFDKTVLSKEGFAYDFDRRLSALGMMARNALQPYSAQPPQIQSLVYQVIATLHVDDFSLRQGAINTLTKFIRYTGEHRDTRDGKNKINVLEMILIPQIKEGIKSQVAIARKGFLTLLGEVAKSFAPCKIDDYPLLHLDLRYLFDTDDKDQDVFLNLMHVQVHRRARALQKFRTIVGSLNANTVTSVFLPLIIHDLHEANKASENVLIEESILTVQAIAEKLPWSRYSNILRMLLTQLKNHPDREKLLIKAVSAIVDAFHFDMSATVMKALRETFLPTLNAFLVQNDEGSLASLRAVRVPIALSIVKILKRLPKDMLMQQLLKLLSQVCSLLKSKEQRTRNETKLTLCKIIEELGSEYAIVVITELRKSLKEGFMLHVLGNVVHAILNSLPPDVLLDDCVGSVVEVMTEDIFGDVARQRNKESGYIPSRDIQEAQSCKSFGTYEILAARVTFDTHIDKLTEPLNGMGSRFRPGQECQAVMKHLIIGLSKNSTLTATRLVNYSLDIIAQNLRGKEGYEDLWISYAVDLFNMALKRRIISSKTEEHRELLNRCVEQLVRCCQTCKSDYVLSGSLKCLSTMITWDLPAIKTSIQPILDQMFRMLRLHSSGSGGKDVRQSCFRTIALMLRKTKLQIKDSRMRVIISLADADLDHMLSQNATFSLIKAIISRQVILPELYDLITKISKLLVTSLKIPVQDLCAQVFSEFLQVYPMGNKRRLEHMNAMLKNLSYPYETGRLSALNMMHRILKELSDDAIHAQGKNFFVQLVLRVVNEDSEPCRAKVMTCVQVLLERVTATQFEHLLGMAMQWIKNDGADEQSRLMAVAGLQCFGVACEVRSARMAKHMNVINDMIIERFHDRTIHWEVMYNSMVVLEKSVKLWTSSTSVLLPHLVACLMHEHAWVRAASSRVIGNALALTSVTAGTLGKSDAIFQLLRNVCHQFKFEDLHDDAAQQAMQTLVRVCGLLCSDKDRRVGAKSKAEEEKDPISWVFQRLSFCSRQMQTKAIFARRGILQFFISMANAHPDVAKTSLHSILSCVYRLSRAKEGQHVAKETISLAEEVMDVLQDRIGSEEYLKGLDSVRGKVFAVQTSRKRERQLEKVTNPALAARKKLRKNKDKKSSRKRKVEELRAVMGR